MNRTINYLTWFDNFTNVEFVKSPYMIIYHLAKQHPECRFILAGSTLSEQILKTDNQPDNLAISIKKRGLLKRLCYLFKNAKSVQVLHLYHFKPLTAVYAIIYKLINPSGILYVKADADERIFRYYKRNKKFDPFDILRYSMRFIITKLSSIISVETKHIFDRLMTYDKKGLAEKLFINPYGIDINRMIPYYEPLAIKEKLIVTIGRIGTHQKNTEMLLNALKTISDFKGWKIKIIGPIENAFKNTITEFYQTNPQLKQTVSFEGNIEDRSRLSEILKQSVVFVLTSRFESWGIVLTEAGFFGNFIVSTDTGCASQLIKAGNFGKIIEQNDPDSLSKALTDIINNPKLPDIGTQIHDFCLKKYNWADIVENLWGRIAQSRRRHERI